MFLRTMHGLPESALRQKFPEVYPQVADRLVRLEKRGWLQHQEGRWSLTTEGQLISNKVFEELTFLQSELEPGALTAATPDSYCSV